MTAEDFQNSPHSHLAVERLVSMILSEIQQRYRLDLSRDPAAMNRIRESARKALLELANYPEAEIDLPYISADSRGPIHYTRRLTRSDLELPPDIPASPGERKAGAISIKLPEDKPTVTITLLVLMGVIYLVQMLTQFAFNQDLPAALGMKINQAILAGQYWRLVTPMFLHGGILHISFNLYALYILGREVERFYGHWRFLALFLISGIAGNLFSFFFTTSPSLGSSTAIFGLLSAEGVFIYQHKRLFGERFSKALGQIVMVGVINLIIGLSPGIDNWGHLGGLLGGLGFAWFGGPIWEVEGKAPLLRLSDHRPARKSWPIFIGELCLLIAAAAWVIHLRS